MRQVFRKIGRAQRKQNSDLLKLKVPIDPKDDPKQIARDDTKWKYVHEAKQQEQAILQRNIKHFGQAEREQTLFFQQPLE